MFTHKSHRLADSIDFLSIFIVFGLHIAVNNKMTSNSAQTQQSPSELMEQKLKSAVENTYVFFYPKVH